MVYVDEAHAGDGPPEDRLDFGIPKSIDDRRRAACELVCRLNLKAPVLLDNMQNTTYRDYGVASARLYLIDPDGRVAYKSTTAPQTFRPESLDPHLIRILPRTPTVR